MKNTLSLPFIIMLFSCGTSGNEQIIAAEKDKDSISNLAPKINPTVLKNECLTYPFVTDVPIINRELRIDMDSLVDIELTKLEDSDAVELHKKMNILQNYNVGGYIPAQKTKLYTFAGIEALTPIVDNYLIFAQISHHYQACYLYVCFGEQARSVLISEVKEGMHHVYSDILPDGKIIRYTDSYFINEGGKSVNISYLQEEISFDFDVIKYRLLNTESKEEKLSKMKQQKYIDFEDIMR